MMKFLEHFEEFKNSQHLNEDAARKAARKKRNADNLIKKAEKALEEGDKEKADRLLNRASKRIDSADKLVDDVEFDQMRREITDLKTQATGEDTSTTPDETPEENKFDLESKEHRDKIKADGFEYINKLKVKGDSISNEELNGFLKTVKNYLNEYWDKLNDGEFPSEYQSPYTDFTLVVTRGLGRTVFKYKEGQFTDKIKLVFSNSDFKKEGAKDKIMSELDVLLGSDDIKKEVEENNTDKTNDTYNEPVAPVVPPDKTSEVPAVDPGTQNKVGASADAFSRKDDNFINEAVKLLIAEKLNVGSVNTNEDLIYDFFVKKNATKVLVAENMTGVLVNYKKQKSMSNESVVDSFKRATQSVTTQESKGVIGDLMNAFNTDAAKISKDMNEKMRKIAGAFQAELNKVSAGQVKEWFGMDTSSLLGGYFVGRNLPKVVNLMKKKEAVAAATNTQAIQTAGGGIKGVSRFGKFLTNPYFWVPLMLGSAAVGSKLLWNSFDAQQTQVSQIILLMWASGSIEVTNEMKKNGIRFTVPNIDISKLKGVMAEMGDKAPLA